MKLTVIKLTLQQILNSLQALNQLGEEKLPARLSFTIARVVGKLQAEGLLFQGERQKLFVKYGEQVPPRVGQADGNQLKIPPEKIPGFNEEMNILLGTEVELDGLGRISISALEDAEIQVKPNILIALDWLFIGDSDAV